jgi:GAF domain-containing protein
MGEENGARYALVLRLARQVTARHDLDDVLSETFRALRPLLAFERGSIQLVDDEGWIRIAAAEPHAAPHVMARSLPLGESTPGRVVLTEQPVYLSPVADADELGRVPGDIIGSWYGVPLLVDGAAIGLLQVDSPEADAWSAQERELLLLAAPVVAAAIQNARANARAASARAQSLSATRRLHEARHLTALLRLAHADGDAADVERLLGRLELLLGDAPPTRRPGRSDTLGAGIPQPRALAG